MNINSKMSKHRIIHIEMIVVYYFYIMDLSEIKAKIRAIDERPELMLKDEGREAQFMKEWYGLGSSQVERKQFSYVWSLINGWELQQLSSSSLLTLPPLSNNKSLLNKQIPKKTQSLHRESFEKNNQNTLQYLSKNEVFIKFQGNLIWINPSQPYPQVKMEDLQLIIVLTSSNISQILNLIQFQDVFHFKLITTEAIYRKIKQVISFLTQIQPINIPTTYLLKPDQYFEYAHIMWLIRQNCWLEHTYDIHLSFPHSRQNFLIESSKLEETKLVYYGWKKNQISQYNYQKYIREWDRTITRSTAEVFIIPSLPAVKKEKVDWYLSFIQKELINNLSNHEKDHLFACCEVIDLIPNQIIAKKGYRFDYLFILLQGEFQLREPHQQADTNKFYGLVQLNNREEQYGFTLASSTAGIIMRIDKENVLFHLYDLLH